MSVYEQKLSFKRYRRIELTEDFADVTMRGRGYSENFRIALDTLHPKPNFASRRNHSWIGWASCCVLIGCLFVWGGFANGEVNAGSAIVAGIGLLFYWWAFRFFVFSRDQNYDMVFYYHPNESPAFSLFQSKAGDEEYRAFLEEIDERIRRAIETRLGRAQEIPGSLSAEIKRLKELHADGSISDLEFEKAKARILGDDGGGRAIGFHAQP